MYAFIEGQVCEKSTGELVLLAGGVGYKLLCSANTLQAAPAMGETMRCHTWLSVREDAMDLYGFATREEKNMFMLLTSVSGVGPKMALALLGSMTLRDLTLAIVLDDVTALSKAPGVGKKTAQRIALELKDKVSQGDVAAAAAVSPAASVSQMAGTDHVAEVIEALQALGYSPAEARSAVSRLPDQSVDADELLRLALRAMAGL